MYKVFHERDKAYFEEMVKIHMESLSNAIGVPVTISSSLQGPRRLDVNVSFVIGGQDTQIKTNNSVDTERREFEALCHRYGFEPSEYGRKIRTQGGKEYRLIGFNTRAPKNPCKLIDENNIGAKCSEVLVKRLFV